MKNPSEQGGDRMNNENGNSNYKKFESNENKQLKSLLQRAVNSEKASDSLRDKISKMIRKK